jgi:hypothetical protein
MALELFANFERTSNNSVFYRLVSSNPYSLTLRLSDLNVPTSSYEDYLVKVWLNNDEPNPVVNQEFNNLTDFNYLLAIDCSIPCLCSFNVLASSSTGFESSYVLSGSFLQNYPTATFVAYPSAYIDTSSVFTLSSLKELNSFNYRANSPGVFFYGEGHTETVFLSASYQNTNNLIWFVGNSVNEIQNNSSVIPVTSTSVETAFVRITSDLASSNIYYPISLWSTNTQVTTSGPLYRYDDITGEKTFYPFFVSTRNINNTPVLSTRYFSDIEVKTYPVQQTFSLLSPFPSGSFVLPVTLESRYFIGYVLQTPSASSILTENFYGTRWRVNAEANLNAPTPDWETTTAFLPFISAYQFPLSYQTQDDINNSSFKASIGFNTSITLNVSASKLVRLSQASDWKPKIQEFAFGDSTTINPLPVARLYTSNYYNLINTPVSITNVEPNNFTAIRKVIVTGNKSPNTLEFSGPELFTTKTMVFSGIGLISLSATTTFVDEANREYTITSQFPNFIEVINQYDQIDPQYYKTPTALGVLKQIKAPRLSPNEWVTSDNVNSVLRKLYFLLGELELYTKSYQTKSNFSARSEQVNVLTWQDLYCEQLNGSDTSLLWSTLSACNDPFSPVFEFGKWRDHICEGDESFANLICKRKNWTTPFIDLVDFSLISDLQNPECLYTGIALLNGELNSNIIVSYDQEIQIFKNDYKATYLGKRTKADEVFNFSKIVAVQTTSDNKIVVLDQNLPRVSVFTVNANNSLNLFATWGRFGLQQNLQGFNKPNDITVDQDNRIWVCDTGNECIKQYTLTGKNLLVLTNERFEDNAPLSLTIDSENQLHVLTQTAVLVFDKNGNLKFEYELPEAVEEPQKISTSYNKEVLYITYNSGVAKFFKNGNFFEYLVRDLLSAQGNSIIGFRSIIQDQNRNVYVTVKDQILKFADLMNLVDSKAQVLSNLLWNLNDLLIDKEEYVQPWVYLKSFHRMWDNIELLRNSLYYNETSCKSYTNPPYNKENLILGQNEIVTNSTINRLAEQLWINIQSILDYFDAECLEKRSFKTVKAICVSS